jgi:hypothetical protein
MVCCSSVHGPAPRDSDLVIIDFSQVRWSSSWSYKLRGSADAAGKPGLCYNCAGKPFSHVNCINLPHQSIDRRMAYVFSTGSIPLSNLVVYSIRLLSMHLRTKYAWNFTSRSSFIHRWYCPFLPALPYRNVKAWKNQGVKLSLKSRWSNSW